MGFLLTPEEMWGGTEIEMVPIDEGWWRLVAKRGPGDMASMMLHSKELLTAARQLPEVARLVEACENLENDNGAIPHHAWKRIQAALATFQADADAD